MDKKQSELFVKQIPTAQLVNDVDEGYLIERRANGDITLQRISQVDYGIPYLGKVEPTMATYGAAGYDLTAAEDVTIPARGRALAHTGLRMALPTGICAVIHGRSGLALKHGVVAFNGIIDSDYRGDVGVLLFNHSDEDYEVHAGDRIAQMLLIGHVALPFLLTEDLAITDRGAGGFGSTGV